MRSGKEGKPSKVWDLSTRYQSLNLGLQITRPVFGLVVVIVFLLTAMTHCVSRGGQIVKLRHRHVFAGS